MSCIIRQLTVDPRDFPFDPRCKTMTYRQQHALWVGSQLAWAGFVFEPFDPTDPATSPILKSPCSHHIDPQGRHVFRQQTPARTAN